MPAVCRYSVLSSSVVFTNKTNTTHWGHVLFFFNYVHLFKSKILAKLGGMKNQRMYLELVLVLRLCTSCGTCSFSSCGRYWSVNRSPSRCSRRLRRRKRHRQPRRSGSTCWCLNQLLENIQYFTYWCRLNGNSEILPK